MSEKQSRLAGIQDMVLNSTKDTFFDRAIVLDLLAVVEAALDGTTPSQQVLVCGVSLGLETDPGRRERLHDQRDAWLDLR